MWNFREICEIARRGTMVPQRVAAMQRALLRRVLPRLSRSVCTKPDAPKSPPPPSALTIAASGLTSFAGIGAISALHFGIAPHDLTMVLGSMGASAVLLYGAPAAPFSQPRNLFLGHGIACVVGVTAHELISVPMDTPILAAPLAVSSSIVLMHLTRSLHPPAGGTVLIAVLGSPELHALGYSLLVPTMLDTTLLFGVALANNAFGIRYPAR